MSCSPVRSKVSSSPAWYCAIKSSCPSAPSPSAGACCASCWAIAGSCACAFIAGSCAAAPSSAWTCSSSPTSSSSPESFFSDFLSSLPSASFFSHLHSSPHLPHLGQHSLSSSRISISSSSSSSIDSRSAFLTASESMALIVFLLSSLMAFLISFISNKA